MSEKEIVLSKLIKDLGFDEPKALNNWIRNIMVDKKMENKEFYKIFTNYKNIEPEYRYRCDDVFKVKEEARTFVENLCILKPYFYLFGRASPQSRENCESSPNTEFPPYELLKKGDYKYDLAGRHKTLKEKLELQKKRDENSLKGLSKIVAVFNSNKKIDITIDSIRDMLNKVTDVSEAGDFSKSFEIAAWNDLVELKEQLREQDEDGETYRKIGEKMLELNDLEGAIDALDEAIIINPEDGTAWSLKAKIYLDLLRSSKKERMEALSRTDFSGFIEHPINGEEQCVNERIEDTYSSTEKLHGLFIEACFNALANWPCRSNSLREGRNGVQIKHFKPVSTGDISRAWVFFHLVINIKKSDIHEKYAEELIYILRTFQNSVLDPMPDLIFKPDSLESQNKTPFQLKLTEIMNWVSNEDCQQFLNYFIQNFERYKSNAEENIVILSRSNIKHLFWNYLGKEKYLSLYALLESYQDKNRSINKLESLCSLQCDWLLSDLGEIKEELKNKRYSIFSNVVFNEQEFNEKWRIFIEQSYNKIKGWDEFFTNEIWLEKYPSHRISKTVLFFFICPLIELQNNKPTDIGIKVIADFSNSKELLKTVVSDFSSDLLDELVTPIIENYPEQTYSWMSEVSKTLMMALEIKQELEFESFDDMGE